MGANTVHGLAAIELGLKGLAAWDKAIAFAISKELLNEDASMVLLG